MDIRILIGSMHEQISRQLENFLLENGFSVVGTAKEGHELLRKVRMLDPDLVITDYELRGISGKEVAEVIANDRLTPVIMMVNATQQGYFYDLQQEFGMACVLKPLNKRALLQAIRLLIAGSRRVRKLEKEVQQLKKKLDTTQTIEKAKRLLMEHKGLAEQEAHRKIQKQSMDKGISKLEVAKAIIVVYG